MGSRSTQASDRLPVSGCLFEPVPSSVSLSSSGAAGTRETKEIAEEKARLNAAALRVLAFLQRHGEATNVELCDPSVGGMRAIGRVHELRQDGWRIEKQHISGGLWRYTLKGFK